MAEHIGNPEELCVDFIIYAKQRIRFPAAGGCFIFQASRVRENAVNIGNNENTGNIANNGNIANIWNDWNEWDRWDAWDKWNTWNTRPGSGLGVVAFFRIVNC